MLSQDNIDRINDQIDNELRIVGRLSTDADEKAEALDRITKLKALLYPQPSTEEIMTKFAEAVGQITHPGNREPTPAERLVDALFSR